jgi:hypothetical protein
MINHISFNNKLIKQYQISEDKLEIIKDLQIVVDQLNKIIKTKLVIDHKSYKSCNKIIKKKKYKSNLINNYLGQYRFCKMLGIIEFNTELYETLVNIIRNVHLEMTFNNNFNNNFKSFIIKNLDNIILCMICNILQNIIEKLHLRYDICEEIQPILISLNSIEYFMEQIKLKEYYVYELIFLLQSEYFLTKNQLDKYREIRNKLSTDNDELELHQFMMGKGKTSVFTPLLAYSIKLLKNKQPTIITSSHLETDTKKIISLKMKKYQHHQHLVMLILGILR